MGIKFNSLVIMNFLDIIYLMNIFTIFIILKKKSTSNLRFQLKMQLNQFMLILVEMNRNELDNILITRIVSNLNQ